jgi:hypothetical protein
LGKVILFFWALSMGCLTGELCASETQSKAFKKPRTVVVDVKGHTTRKGKVVKPNFRKQKKFGSNTQP